MAQNLSDNIQLNAPKVLDNRSGRFQSGKWRPWNTVQEFLDAQVLLSRAETQEFWVRSPVNADRADLYTIDKNGSPYKVIPDVDLSNYYNKTEIEGLLIDKQDDIPYGNSGEYYAGNKTFIPLTKASVGLSLADNTPDVSKPLSTPTKTYVDAEVAKVAVDSISDDGDVFTYDGTNNVVTLIYTPIEAISATLNGKPMYTSAGDYYYLDNTVVILKSMNIGTEYSLHVSYKI